MDDVVFGSVEVVLIDRLVLRLSQVPVEANLRVAGRTVLQGEARATDSIGVFTEGIGCSL